MIEDFYALNPYELNREEKEKMLEFLEEEKLKWEAMYELELY